MACPVRVGDIALITIGDQEHLLEITAVEPRIVAGQRDIIRIGNCWQVQNFPLKHFVTFIAIASASSLTTHIPEITSRILLNLNYDDLMSACNTNKDFNKVCHDNYFWKLKIEHDFGTITRYELPNISHHQQYIYLMATKNPNRAAKEGRLDILEWLAGYNIFPDEDSANDAVKSRNFDVLEWLVLHDIKPDIYIINDVVKYRNFDMLEWLVLHDIKPDMYIINDAARTEDLELLDWLAQFDLHPDRYTVDDAAEDGNLKILKWLARHDIYPTRRGASAALKNRQWRVVKWLDKHGIYPHHRDDYQSD